MIVKLSSYQTPKRNASLRHPIERSHTMAYRKRIEELGLENAVSCVVARHASAEMDPKNREQVRGYIHYPEYDPGLSQKGKDSMAEIVRKMPGVHKWYTGPARRSYETALYFCSDIHDLPEREEAFQPPNPSSITEDIIDEWMETFNDDLLLDAYVASGDYEADQERALLRLIGLIQVANVGYDGANIPFGVVVHNETGRLINAFCYGMPAKYFINDGCEIAKGEFVIITFHPDGNIEVRKSEDIQKRP